jgi:hypothetical protein
MAIQTFIYMSLEMGGGTLSELNLVTGVNISGGEGVLRAFETGIAGNRHA